MENNPTFQVGDLVTWIDYPTSLGLITKIDNKNGWIWIEWFYPERWHGTRGKRSWMAGAGYLKLVE